MNERLDRLITQLADAPTDHALDRLEAEISRGIGRRRVEARTAAALTPVGVAAVGLAMAVGLSVGGVTAAAAAAGIHRADTFTVAANLAPSTLLEGGR